jgi:putative membrane protein
VTAYSYDIRLPVRGDLSYKLFTSMRTASRILTLLVALEHMGILVLEMFFWNHPVGQRIFGMTPEVSAASAVLAANQGLYNGFLAAGLFWGLFTNRRAVVIFFLVCVVIAGLFGGLTAKTSILLTQGVPALFALLLTLASRAEERR